MRRVAGRVNAWSAVASVLGVAFAPPVGAQVAVGGEFQVNTHTPGEQGYPAVAAGPDGSFVAVWESEGSSGTDDAGTSIQGQRYASSGSAAGGEFQVNSYTPSYQRYPTVAVESDGDFVVVWQSDGSSGTDASGSSIQGQRHASDGSAQGGEFQVNTYTTGPQFRPGVAIGPDGDFVVVWHGYGSSGADTSGSSVHGQRYASDGSAVGVEFQINTLTTSYQNEAAVAADPDGGFVVVWQSGVSLGSDSFFGSIQARRYASDGSPLGAEFQVNTQTAYTQGFPDIASDADGDLVVVWHGYGDTSPLSVQGQRYASDGSPLGGEFQVNTYTQGLQWHPRVAADPGGDFVVVWQSAGSYGTDGSSYSDSVQGQRYASDGSAQGGEFQVNTFTTGAQVRPAAGAASGGDFVVVWASDGSYGSDSQLLSVQGQRYVAFVPKVPSISPGSAAAAALLMLAAVAVAFRRRA
jgi:hypothetical protein